MRVARQRGVAPLQMTPPQSEQRQRRSTSQAQTVPPEFEGETCLQATIRMTTDRRVHLTVSLRCCAIPDFVVNLPCSGFEIRMAWTWKCVPLPNESTCHAIGLRHQHVTSAISSADYWRKMSTKSSYFSESYLLLSFQKVAHCISKNSGGEQLIFTAALSSPVNCDVAGSACSATLLFHTRGYRKGLR
ncbi:hypothetical protein K458DRAFT_66366 [Lentithecium fluviatile CBS 122367]|uniref:Uncharacterized protein n=1 Tax=Lentithecium fluviatile CBS 122367 TaxID=1168545 RepID=A0A6G1JKE1_9PLEO|nr:hypothetical protein K458DRAFT_66366 [Lentithecium fluviatile CBS 122367]